MNARTDVIRSTIVFVVLAAIIAPLFFLKDSNLQRENGSMSPKTVAAREAMMQKIRAAKSGDLLVTNNGRVYLFNRIGDEATFGGGTFHTTNGCEYFGFSIVDLAKIAYDIVPQTATSTYNSAAACAFRGRFVTVDGPPSTLFTCGN